MKQDRHGGCNVALVEEDEESLHFEKRNDEAALHVVLLRKNLQMITEHFLAPR